MCFLITPYIQWHRQVPDVTLSFCICYLLSIYEQTQLSTIIYGIQIVPVVLPICRQFACSLIEFISIYVEGDVFLTFLLYAKLFATFGNERSTATDQFTRIDLHSYCQLIRTDFHIISTIHLYPLVVSIKVEYCSVLTFQQLSITHQMCWGVERRVILHQTGRFLQARTYKVPDSTTHRSRMVVDHSPKVVQSSTSISSNREIFIHERRAYVTIAMQTYLQVKFFWRRITWAYDFLCRMTIGIAPIHP